MTYMYSVEDSIYISTSGGPMWYSRALWNVIILFFLEILGVRCQLGYSAPFLPSVIFVINILNK